MKELDFETAFKYPFNRPKGMLNILWVLIPIIGWFAIGGYSIRIIEEFLKGKFKQLPELKLGNDFKLGFFMFLKSIPFFLIYILFSGILGEVSEALSGLFQFLTGLLIIPIMSINFFKKQTVQSYFEFEKTKAVFTNFGDYIMAILKGVALGIIFIFMIIILVGIPASSFTKNIFIADFYRRKVK